MPRQLVGSDALVGNTLGHYRIVAKIGAGGMGDVYLARDEHLDREVAVKVLPAGTLADDTARRRFHKEALALSKLNHPHIATIYDFDTQGGIDFLSMEYIDGSPLSARIGSAPLQENEILHLGAQIAEGLDAAHRKGIVHGDLKPSNLMVTPEGRLKILDFGLAKDVRPVEETASLSELPGAAGTLPYMAPEQLTGEKIDARTDIFALGIVLYEMACGRLPYPHSQWSLLIGDILHYTPPSPQTVNPQLSIGLENIIEKSIERDPERRYQSVGELLVDLRRLISPGTAAVHTGALSAMWRRRRRTTISSLTVAIVVIVTLWIVGSRPALSFAPRDWLLVADFENHTGEAALDRSLNAAFAVSLEQSTHANVYPRIRIKDALKRMGKPDAPEIDEALGREICVRENIRGLLTCAISKIGSKYTLSARLVDPRSGTPVRSYIETATDQDHVLDALGHISSRIRRDLGESLASLKKNDRPLPLVTTGSLQALKLYADGTDLWAKGKWPEGVNLFKQAVQADPEFAMAHAALGRAYFSHVYNDPKQGREETEKALALANRTTDRERQFIQAEFQSDLKHYDEATGLFQAYLATYPDDWGTRHNFATMLRDANRPQEAAEQFQEVLRIAPNDAGAYINLATAYDMLGNFPSALKAYDSAFKLEPTWITLGNLNQEYGFTLLESGDEAKAREVFAKAMATPFLKGRAYRSLGFLAMYHGQYKLAEENFRSAIEFHVSKKESLSEGRTHLFLAALLRAKNRHQEATRELDLALKTLEASTGSFNFQARVGVEYLHNAQLAKASAVFAKLAKEFDLNNAEQSADFYRFQGELLLAKGQSTNALGALNDAARSDAILARCSLARAQGAMGQADAAIATLERIVREPSLALSWEAQDPWLQGHYELAELYVSRGRSADAAKLLDHFLTMWSEGDGDLPLLKAARHLRASLPG